MGRRAPSLSGWWPRLPGWVGHFRVLPSLLSPRPHQTIFSPSHHNFCCPRRGFEHDSSTAGCIGPVPSRLQDNWQRGSDQASMPAGAAAAAVGHTNVGGPFCQIRGTRGRCRGQKRHAHGMHGWLHRRFPRRARHGPHGTGNWATRMLTMRCDAGPTCSAARCSAVQHGAEWMRACGGLLLLVMQQNPVNTSSHVRRAPVAYYYEQTRNCSVLHGNTAGSSALC